jgi:hypothetical protein
MSRVGLTLIIVFLQSRYTGVRQFQQAFANVSTASLEEQDGASIAFGSIGEGWPHQCRVSTKYFVQYVNTCLRHSHLCFVVTLLITANSGSLSTNLSGHQVQY